MNLKLIPVAIIIVGILIAGAIYYESGTKCPGLRGEEGEIISSQEAEEKVIGFINQNILRGRGTASSVETVEDNGLYKVKFAVGEQEIESYLTLDGRLFFPEAINLTEVQPAAVEKEPTIGNFSVNEEEVCLEDGKPIVYFFGSESCPYCQWEHPIVEGVAGKFSEYIAFHNNMDTQDDMDIFQKYSTGGIPTLVFGCKYSRVGAGQQAGEEGETQALTALICKLTDSKPADVCDEVQDLINQIEG